MKLLIFTFINILLPVFAIAAPYLTSPMDIDADTLEIFPKEQKAIFAGNVKASQKKLTLNCDTLSLLFIADTLEKAVATGHVVFIQGNDKATGDKAVYDLNNQKLILTGNVKLYRGKTILTGTHLIYDLITEKINLKNKGGRVRARIVPQNKLK